MKLFYPKIPPAAFTLNPKPTVKNVRELIAITKIDLIKMTLFCFIFMVPVSFIRKPTYAMMIMIPQMTTHTVSRMSANVVIRLSVLK
jgi:hypothetical protein